MKPLGSIAKGDVDPVQLGLAAVAETRGRLHEEVQQRGSDARAGDEHVAACAQTGEQRLGHERGERRRNGRVDRVAAFAQHLRPCLRGQRMPGCDDPLFSSAHGRAIPQVSALTRG